MSASPERSPGPNPSGRHNASPAARRQGDLLALGGSSGQWPLSALPPAVAGPAQNHDRAGPDRAAGACTWPLGCRRAGQPARALRRRPNALQGPRRDRRTRPRAVRATGFSSLPPVRIPDPVASLIPGGAPARPGAASPPPAPLTRPAGTKTSRSPRACRPSPPSCTSPFRDPRAPTTATGSPTPAPAGSAPRRPARRRARPPRC